MYPTGDEPIPDPKRMKMKIRVPMNFLPSEFWDLGLMADASRCLISSVKKVLTPYPRTLIYFRDFRLENLLQVSCYPCLPMITTTGAPIPTLFVRNISLLIRWPMSKRNQAATCMQKVLRNRLYRRGVSWARHLI